MSDGLVLLSFPARADYLILPRLALAGVARAVPMAEEVLADLKLAVTEACGNAVRHAYGDGVGTIRVTITTSGERVEIAVEDDGIGPPAEMEIPSLDGDGRESGMGLAIIAAIADELEVGRGEAGGTRLVIGKTTRSEEPAA